MSAMRWIGLYVGLTAALLVGCSGQTSSQTIAQAPQALRYAQNPVVYTAGQAILANHPASDGGAVVSYRVTPALPAGLVFDPATGILAGTPASACAPASYAVTAGNAGGSAVVDLYLTVNPAPPAAPPVTVNPYVTSGRTGRASTPDLGPGMTYSWSVAGGLLLSGQGTPSITFQAGAIGLLSVSVQVANVSGKASGTASAGVVALPSAELALPVSVHPGDDWMQASVPDQEGIATQWTVLPGQASASLISGQGTGLVRFAAGPGSGTFQLQATVQNRAGDSVSSARTVTVGTGTWVVKNGGPSGGRFLSTLTRLASGRLLVAGGLNSQCTIPTERPRITEIFDPLSGTWQASGALLAERSEHTATLLANGKVLVTGGMGAIDAAGNDSLPLASAELYDPASGTWASTGSMGTGRSAHKAVLLADGKVLVMGGDSETQTIGTVECYDPASGRWTYLASPARADKTSYFVDFTATLLANGKVLVVGIAGTNKWTTQYPSSAMLFDPVDGTWAATGSPLESRRTCHSATLLASGKVLVAGGGDYGDRLASAEVYDPASGTWSALPDMAAARRDHTASLLGSGKVLVAGGGNGGGATNCVSEDIAGAELFDPAKGSWEPAGALGTARSRHLAAPLADGRVLVLGGDGGNFTLASPECYDPRSNAWTAAPDLGPVHDWGTLTKLTDGSILAAGGYAANQPHANAEIGDPATGKWIPVGNMGLARFGHSATLLANGKVLVAGGVLAYNQPITSAELFDPGTGRWTPTGAMRIARAGHQSVLLSSGQVMVIGGAGEYVELYDPVSGTWSSAPDFYCSITSPTLLQLPGGKVLVAGGLRDWQYPITSASIFDFPRGSWVTGPTMPFPTGGCAAVPLNNGQVLLAGGDYEVSNWYEHILQGTSAELFDPVSGSLVATGRLGTAREHSASVLLPGGKLLVAGGATIYNHFYGSDTATSELYDPKSGTWSPTGPLPSVWLGSAFLMGNGTVVLGFTGGMGSPVYRP